MSEGCAIAYEREAWQKAQFELLLKFDDLCREHGLSYSLDFGSMLGAVRHRGCIPWDNDIDVCMLQSEYDRLLALVSAGVLPEGCVVADRSFDEGYPYVFGRLFDTRTTCFMSRLGWHNDDGGVFLDIFALRPLPRGRRPRSRAVRDFLVYEEYCSDVYRRAGNRTLAFKLRYLQLIAHARLHGRAKTLSWIKRKADRGLDSKDAEWFLVNSGGVYNGYPLRRREWVEKTVLLPVKGRMLPVFAGHLEILRLEYTDGWRYWPEGEQDFEPRPASLNVPQSVALADSFAHFDKKRVLKALKEYKRLSIKDMLLRGRYSREVYRAQGVLSLAHAQAALEKAGVDVRGFHGRCRALSSETLAEAQAIAQAFDGFYALQTDGRRRYWRVATPIDRELLASSLWALLIARREYWLAASIMELYAADRRTRFLVASSAPLRALSRLMKDLSDAHLLMDRGDASAVAALADRIEAQAESCYELGIVRTWLDARADPPRLAERAEGLFERYGDNGEFLSYVADALEASGDAARAEETRLKALGLTSNGMVVMSLRQKLGMEG